MRCNFWLAAGASAILITAHLLPVPQNGNLAGLPTLCPLKLLVGCPCPGCGLTRSLVLCAHSDWAQAFSFHPLGPIFYLALWLLLLKGVLPSAAKEGPASQKAALVLGSTCGASLLIVWLVRLTGMFPFPANF